MTKILFDGTDYWRGRGKYSSRAIFYDKAFGKNTTFRSLLPNEFSYNSGTATLPINLDFTRTVPVLNPEGLFFSSTHLQSKKTFNLNVHMSQQGKVIQNFDIPSGNTYTPPFFGGRATVGNETYFFGMFLAYDGSDHFVFYRDGETDAANVVLRKIPGTLHTVDTYEIAPNPNPPLVVPPLGPVPVPNAIEYTDIRGFECIVGVARNDYSNSLPKLKDDALIFYCVSKNKNGWNLHYYAMDIDPSLQDFQLEFGVLNPFYSIGAVVDMDLSVKIDRVSFSPLIHTKLYDNEVPVPIYHAHCDKGIAEAILAHNMYVAPTPTDQTFIVGNQYRNENYPFSTNENLSINSVKVYGGDPLEEELKCLSFVKPYSRVWSDADLLYDDLEESIVERVEKKNFAQSKYNLFQSNVLGDIVPMIETDNNTDAEKTRLDVCCSKGGTILNEKSISQKDCPSFIFNKYTQGYDREYVQDPIAQDSFNIGFDTEFDIAKKISTDIFFETTPSIVHYKISLDKAREIMHVAFIRETGTTVGPITDVNDKRRNYIFESAKEYSISLVFIDLKTGKFLLDPISLTPIVRTAGVFISRSMAYNENVTSVMGQVSFIDMYNNTWKLPNAISRVNSQWPFSLVYHEKLDEVTVFYHDDSSLIWSGMVDDNLSITKFTIKADNLTSAATIESISLDRKYIESDKKVHQAISNCVNVRGLQTTAQLFGASDDSSRIIKFYPHAFDFAEGTKNDYVYAYSLGFISAETTMLTSGQSFLDYRGCFPAPLDHIYTGTWDNDTKLVTTHVTSPTKGLPLRDPSQFTKVSITKNERDYHLSVVDGFRVWQKKNPTTVYNESNSENLDLSHRGLAVVCSSTDGIHWLRSYIPYHRESDFVYLINNPDSVNLNNEKKPYENMANEYNKGFQIIDCNTVKGEDGYTYVFYSVNGGLYCHKVCPFYMENPPLWVRPETAANRINQFSMNNGNNSGTLARGAYEYKFYEATVDNIEDGIGGIEYLVVRRDTVFNNIYKKRERQAVPIPPPGEVFRERWPRNFYSDIEVLNVYNGIDVVVCRRKAARNDAFNDDNVFHMASKYHSSVGTEDGYVNTIPEYDDFNQTWGPNSSNYGANYKDNQYHLWTTLEYPSVPFNYGYGETGVRGGNYTNGIAMVMDFRRNQNYPHYLSFYTGDTLRIRTRFRLANLPVGERLDIRFNAEDSEYTNQLNIPAFRANFSLRVNKVAANQYSISITTGDIANETILPARNYSIDDTIGLEFFVKRNSPLDEDIAGPTITSMMLDIYHWHEEYEYLNTYRNREGFEKTKIFSRETTSGGFNVISNNDYPFVATPPFMMFIGYSPSANLTENHVTWVKQLSSNIEPNYRFTLEEDTHHKVGIPVSRYNQKVYLSNGLTLSMSGTTSKTGHKYYLVNESYYHANNSSDNYSLRGWKSLNNGYHDLSQISLSYLASTDPYFKNGIHSSRIGLNSYSSVLDRYNYLKRTLDEFSIVDTNAKEVSMSTKSFVPRHLLSTDVPGDQFDYYRDINPDIPIDSLLKYELKIRKLFINSNLMSVTPNSNTRAGDFVILFDTEYYDLSNKQILIIKKNMDYHLMDNFTKPTSTDFLDVIRVIDSYEYFYEDKNYLACKVKSFLAETFRVNASISKFSAYQDVIDNPQDYLFLLYENNKSRRLLEEEVRELEEGIATVRCNIAPRLFDLEEKYNNSSAVQSTLGHVPALIPNVTIEGDYSAYKVLLGQNTQMTCSLSGNNIEYVIAETEMETVNGYFDVDSYGYKRKFNMTFQIESEEDYYALIALIDSCANDKKFIIYSHKDPSYTIRAVLASSITVGYINAIYQNDVSSGLVKEISLELIEDE